MDAAISALENFLDSLSPQLVSAVFDDIVKIFEVYHLDDRICIPAIMTTTRLLDSQFFDNIQDHSQFTQLFEIVQKGTLKTSNIQ